MRNVLVTRVCLSVRRRILTLLHAPGCRLGQMVGTAPSCALLGGFAIGARVSLLWQHSANAICQRVLAFALCLVLLKFMPTFDSKTPKCRHMLRATFRADLFLFGTLALSGIRLKVVYQ